MSAGTALWLVLVFAAAIAPPVFFAWRRHAFQFSLRTLLTVMATLAFVGVVLRSDLHHLGQIFRRPDIASKLISVEIVLFVSWTICLLIDGVPVLARRFWRSR